MLNQPTIAELLAGLTDDGELPPLPSAKLYPPGEAPGAAAKKTRGELVSERIEMRALRDQLYDLDRCREWNLLCLERGMKELRESSDESLESKVEGPESREADRATDGGDSDGSRQEADGSACAGGASNTGGSQPPDSAGETPASRTPASRTATSRTASAGETPASRTATSRTASAGGTPASRTATSLPASAGETPASRTAASRTASAGGASNTDGSQPPASAGETPAGRTGETSVSRTNPVSRAPREATIKPLAVATLAERAARALPKISAARVAVLRQIAKLAAVMDTRAAFLHDRAHAVVADTLFAMDEAFEEVGFGSWMPFRYPDQWLLFTGLLNRVLAANGLIGAKNAAVYRRLLEETPPVERAEGEAEPPKGIAQCHENQPVKALDELWKLVAGP